jgi:hypothetical protein
MERQGEIMFYDLVLRFRKFAKTGKTRIKVLPIVCIGWYLSEQGKFFKIREGGKTNIFLCKTRELLIGNKMFARFEEDQLHPIIGPPLTLKKRARSL